MSKYCQLNYDLDANKDFAAMKAEMGIAGVGAFFEAYKEIRKNGGKLPQEHLIRHLRGLRFCSSRTMRLLRDFGLFETDEHGSVRLRINLASPPLEDKRQLKLELE